MGKTGWFFHISHANFAEDAPDRSKPRRARQREGEGDGAISRAARAWETRMSRQLPARVRAPRESAPGPAIIGGTRRPGRAAAERSPAPIRFHESSKGWTLSSHSPHAARTAPAPTPRPFFRRSPDGRGSSPVFERVRITRATRSTGRPTNNDRAPVLGIAGRPYAIAPASEATRSNLN